ncbi:MAG: ribonuclease P protein component [Candidatus Gracilibacteria bacterium]|nr:ribonuclease P protein component [Candidatus Gracilibacteria bacterium]
MIPKIYRLSENEVKKVLRFRKPFFAYGFIANILPNKVGYNRFGVVFSGKHTKTSVDRNFFRRRLYDTIADICITGANDIVFVPKKGKTFHYKNPEDIAGFDKDIGFLKKLVKK